MKDDSGENNIIAKAVYLSAGELLSTSELAAVTQNLDCDSKLT